MTTTAIHMTFYEAAQRWFDANIKGMSQTYSTRTKRIIDKELYRWHERPFSSIKRYEVIAKVNLVEASGRLEIAKRTYQVLNRLYDYGVTKGWSKTNPASGLSDVVKIKQAQRRKVIDNPEELGRIMAAIEDSNSGIVVQGAVKLSVLLFQTPGHTRSMEVDELHLDHSLWVIPASKTRLGNDLYVPLSDYARGIIEDVLLYTKSKRFVFPGYRGDSKCISDNTIRQALRDAGYGKEIISPGSFRTSSQKLLAKMGWSNELISIQQGRQYEATKELLQENAGYKLRERSRMMHDWTNLVIKHARQQGYSR